MSIFLVIVTITLLNISLWETDQIWEFYCTFYAHTLRRRTTKFDKVTTPFIPSGLEPSTPQFCGFSQLMPTRFDI